MLSALCCGLIMVSILVYQGREDNIATLLQRLTCHHDSVLNQLQKIWKLQLQQPYFCVISLTSATQSGRKLVGMLQFQTNDCRQKVDQIPQPFKVKAKFQLLVKKALHIQLTPVEECFN